MVLCRVCREIAFVPISSCPSLGEQNGPVSPWGQPGDPRLWTKSTKGYVAFLHSSWTELESCIIDSSERDTPCSFCEKIYVLFKNLKPEHPPRRRPERIGSEETSRDDALWLYVEDYPEVDEGGHRGIIRLGHKNTDIYKALRVISIVGKTNEANPEHWGLDQLDGAESFGETTLEDNSTGSLPALDLAKSWLDKCRSEHQACHHKPTTQADLPTRLIDVNASREEEDVALVHPSLQPVESTEYATLSHRWGEHMPLRTMTGLLEEYKRGLPVKNLPPTFRDAVAIVRHMGLRYLWIDSLCVLQDSEQDKAHELPRMGDYYSNAIFNIAAAGSKNCQGGCFQKRNGRVVRAQTIPMRFPGQKSSVYVKVSPFITSIDGEHHSDFSTLEGRGWIFQEQAFSPRILFFEKGYLSFSCPSITAAENHPGGIESARFQFGDYGSLGWSLGLPDRHGYLLNRIGLAISRLEARNEIEEGDRLGLYDLWYGALENYASRNLTYWTDRLPAISGLAKRISVLTGDVYLAGLWKSDLIYGLCWARTSPELDSRPDTRAGQARASPYHAPTWSWASRTQQCLIKHPRRYEAPDYHGKMATYYDGKEWFRILDIWATSAGSNPFGEAKDGALLVSGHLKPVVFRNERVYDGQEVIGSIWEDICITDKVGQRDVYLLPILIKGFEYKRNNSYDGPEYKTECLVLQKIDDGTFQRVGMVRAILDKELKGFEPRQLTIV